MLEIQKEIEKNIGDKLASYEIVDCYSDGTIKVLWTNRFTLRRYLKTIKPKKGKK